MGQLAVVALALADVGPKYCPVVAPMLAEMESDPVRALAQFAMAQGGPPSEGFGARFNGPEMPLSGCVSTG